MVYAHINIKNYRLILEHSSQMFLIICSQGFDLKVCAKVYVIHFTYINIIVCE